MSNQIDAELLILFWQFAISSLEEIDMVSNQHLSIEMFLIRLMYLSSIQSDTTIEKVKVDLKSEILTKNKEDELSSKAINQIKNVAQEEKTKPEAQTEIKAEYKININSFEDLIEICAKKKEIKLKYELEKNVNLVKFEKNRIEISFNESLDKDFVKDLSSKLFDWTGERWIITFSKLKGQMSVKDKQKNVKKQLIDEMKNSEIFKHVIDRFPDAELINVNSNKDGVDND